MEVYDNLTVHQLKRRLIQKGFAHVSNFKTKMEMIEALEKVDRITAPDAPKVSPYKRMTVEELKEQLEERNTENISKFKSKDSMIRELERQDNETPISKVVLLVKKVAPRLNSME
jgi:hypothetical protein